MLGVKGDISGRYPVRLPFTILEDQKPIFINILDFPDISFADHLNHNPAPDNIRKNIGMIGGTVIC